MFSSEPLESRLLLSSAPFASVTLKRNSPAIIQAEDFDNGIAGVAYHDTDAVNQGNSYRRTGVDLQPTSDAGGGYNLGWTHNGEWLNYSVTVLDAGSYSLGVRVSSPVSGASFHFELDGQHLGDVVMPNTHTWQSWRTVTLPAVKISSGQHVLTLVMDHEAPNGYAGNFNYFTLKSEGNSSSQTPTSPTPTSPTPTSPTPTSPTPTSPVNSGDPITWQRPMTITQGGTYSGNWQSTDPNTPVLTIDTSEPVTIINSNLKGPSTLILSNTTSNLTIENVSGYGENPDIYGRPTGYFLDDSNGVSFLTVTGSYMQSTRGIVVDDNNGTIRNLEIRGNNALNIDGRHSNGNGGWISTNDDSDYEIANFIQVRNATVASGDISFNQVVDQKGQSRTEDVINVFNARGTSSHPLDIHDNFIDGSYKANPTVADSNGFSGGGIIVDYNGDYVDIADNQVIDTTNYGVAIAAGHNNTLSGNRVLFDEILPDTNVGIYIWNSPYYPASGWASNAGQNNQVDTANNNDWWIPSSCTWNGNQHFTTTLASEQQVWTAKLTQNGIVLPTA